VSRREDSPEGQNDPDEGIFRGVRIARRYLSPDGFVVLAGKTATDNDLLTFKLSSPRDFWLHISGDSGSHVIVRNPDGLGRLPRDTARFAAAVAARHSRARGGGKVAVHLAKRADVRKERGMAAGKVAVSRGVVIQAAPLPD
jgi:predicted ribosome quality control (RQC) complex YloA/Tae2 family protein